MGACKQETHVGPTIETERLRLRPYEDTDCADIVAYSSDSDFWAARNLGWPPTEEGVREYWEGQKDVDPATDPKWLSLVVELKSEGRVIGNAGFGVSRVGDLKQGSMGWLLGTQYQGRGLATEAVRALASYCFTQLGLHRLSARTGHDNRRSWKLMERLGMRREAYFRQSHVVEGQWRDEYVYAVLAAEWVQAPETKSLE